MSDALNVLMRWLHITSAVVLIGGVAFARLVVAPAMAAAAAGEQEVLGDQMAARFRPLLYLSLLFLLGSGIYNFVMNMNRGPLYQALLGIKLLLALHVFVVGFLIVAPHNAKRNRQMTGVVISGIAILAIAAVLRQLHLN